MPYDTSLDANFTREQMLKILYKYIELKADKSRQDFMETAVEDILVYDYMLVCAANELNISITKEELEIIKCTDDDSNLELNESLSDELDEKIQLLYNHINEKSIDYVKEDLVNMGFLKVNFKDDGSIEYQALGWDGNEDGEIDLDDIEDDEII